MTEVNKIVEGLGKEQLLSWFIVLWGISWILGGLSGFAYTIFSGYPQPLLNTIIGSIQDLVSLAIGGVLTLFGLKLLGMSK